jgi:hypothetical protein
MIQSQIQELMAPTWAELRKMSRQQKEAYIESLREGARPEARRRLYPTPARTKFRRALRGLGYAQWLRKKDVDRVVDLTEMHAHLRHTHSSLSCGQRDGARDARHLLLALAFFQKRPYRDVEWFIGRGTAKPDVNRLRNEILEHGPGAFVGVPHGDQFELVQKWLDAPVTEELQVKKLLEQCTSLARRAKVIEKPQKAAVMKVGGASFRATAGELFGEATNRAWACIELRHRIEERLKTHIEESRKAKQADLQTLPAPADA